MKSAHFLMFLAVLSMPALARAETAAVIPVRNDAGLADPAVASLEAAIEAELSREAGLKVVSATSAGEILGEDLAAAQTCEAKACAAELGQRLGAGLLIQSTLSKGPGGAWLAMLVRRTADAAVAGRSRHKSVREDELAERGREAVAEARGRRAELEPESGAETRVGETVVDGVALKPAGAVIAPEPTDLKPAGQVLQPQRETIEVAPGSGGTEVPVKPAGSVIEPGAADGAMAGNVIVPEPSDSRPAGSVIEPQTETLPVPGDDSGRRWGSAKPPAATPADGPRQSRSETEWYSGWASLGLGLAMGGTAIYFAGQMRDNEGNRDDNLLAAQITGGLAVAAAVTGVTLLLLSRQEGQAPAASAGVAPVRGGAVAGIAARF